MEHYQRFIDNMNLANLKMGKRIDPFTKKEEGKL